MTQSKTNTANYFKKNNPKIFKGKSEFVPFMPEEDKKEYRTEYHSLIIEDVPGGKMPIEDEEGPIEGIYKDTDPYKIFRFYVGDFAEESTDLHRIINILDKADPEDLLEFHIDSNGGSVNEGKLFFAMQNNFDKENVAAFLNVGYSMGALLFCMPDIRIIHEFSDIMFHDYSTMMFGKAGDLETSHIHNASHLRNFFKAFVLDKGFLSEEEFNLMLVGKEYWFDAEEMCKRGIATHVKTRHGTVKAQTWLETQYPEKYKTEPVETKPIKVRKTRVKKGDPEFVEDAPPEILKTARKAKSKE